MSESTDPSRKTIRVKYDELSAKYANQVLLNGTNEELFLDFSSGAVPDPETGELIVPVHTRIAMNPAAARRLHAALEQSLKTGRCTFLYQTDRGWHRTQLKTERHTP